MRLANAARQARSVSSSPRSSAIPAGLAHSPQTRRRRAHTWLGTEFTRSMLFRARRAPRSSAHACCLASSR
eukprot:1592509-Prymnesium_polylepis.1